MIILDTNILSALMSDPPDEAVVAWLDRQARESTWTSSISIMEIRFGLGMMAAGRRRNALENAFRQLLDEKLERRIVAFDESAADAAGVLMAQYRATGTIRDIHDTMIAGIAIARRAAVVSRNVKHFSNAGIEIVNPWQS